MKVTFMQ